MACIETHQLTKLPTRHVSFRSARGEVKYALSNAVFPVSWHGGSVGRRVIWFGFGCVDVTAGGALRTPNGPLAGFVGTKGDDGECECQKQISWEGSVPIQPLLWRAFVVWRFIRRRESFVSRIRHRRTDSGGPGRRSA